MGAGVSNWRLARAVSRLDQMGVVSGTALDVILARRLQEGYLEGDMRRALARFPIPGMAQRALDRYFVPGGKATDQSVKPIPLLTNLQRTAVHHRSGPDSAGSISRASLVNRRG